MSMNGDFCAELHNSKACSKLIGIADCFICAFDLALKIEFLHIKIVDQSGARSPKADDVEP